jgi:hypothetical protein
VLAHVAVLVLALAPAVRAPGARAGTAARPLAQSGSTGAPAAPGCSRSCVALVLVQLAGRGPVHRAGADAAAPTGRAVLTRLPGRRSQPSAHGLVLVLLARRGPALVLALAPVAARCTRADAGAAGPAAWCPR